MANVFVLLFACLSLLPTCSSTKIPFQMTWSQQTFGPDGPWQAVEVKIGSQQQLISLYPGGNFLSHIFTTNFCTNVSLDTSCPAKRAGLFDGSRSRTFDNNSIGYNGDHDYIGGSLNIQAGVADANHIQVATDNWDLQGTIVNNVSMALHESLYTTYPDGSTYPLTVGTLALGFPGTVNQSFTKPEGGPNINASIIAGYLASPLAESNHQTPSNSFGLHIGSVQPKLAPSLIFGGYDQIRVVGKVSNQVGMYPNIDLLDISLNVVDGGSPWNVSSVNGLLSAGNSSIGPFLPLQIEPLNPYLNLPKSTCDAIASWLPVTYQPKFGLYFWNANDPQYQKIVSSPSVLSFTFRKDQTNKENITINVPFMLLNLTLDAPLISTKTPYFPCNAESHGFYKLGRAFLQAAFYGYNWDNGNGQGIWWLAQAPGPNVGSQPNAVPIQTTDQTIAASANDWKASWDGYWKALPGPSSPTTTIATMPSSTSSQVGSTSSSSIPTSGLSMGAKAGIGAGVGGAALIAIIAGIVLFLRRRNAKSSSSSQMELNTQAYEPYPEDDTMQKYAGQGYGPSEMNGHRNEAVELGQTPTKGKFNRYELA
jgi:hypothetical protein